MERLFTPNYRVIAGVPPTATIVELEAEQGMYSASVEFLMQHGGPIAKKILRSVPTYYFETAASRGLLPNIDIRVHRLYPGDYPAYPGWHCDGEFRETYFSQPDLDRTPVSDHIVCTVSSVEGGVSLTEFLAQSYVASITPPTSDHTLWGQVDRQITAEMECRGEKVVTQRAQDGQVFLFDTQTLHRATPAMVRGWRLFFRMSMWHKPNLGAGGMLTKQEQVYTHVGRGW